MVNIDLHKSFFISILRDIYSDPELRTSLGFKGGTAAMLFYNLPRFSVDLDFDLLNVENKERIFEKLKKILPNYGSLDEATDKRYTLFFLITYSKGERHLKIEISKRPNKATFVIKNYLGISMLVMNEADMSACKIAALLTRKRFATRDVFDTWYFFKNNWPINEALLTEKTNLTLLEALEKTKTRVKKIKKTELLAGLGDLLDQSQKDWVRAKLIEELVFYLDLYKSELGKDH
ncbi:MAG: nucleotidyl transferase AbiEii/AbiGii toxin family protein [Anaerolineaceae bacterium]|jgi:predicted nucleotidyltransferase component of viral defense system|nr:nucleotidyl transferase AbiEii/AbiGii toxin family protein [Anaerolineaceae bacterium]